MIDYDNSLVVASFKDLEGEIIKTIRFDKDDNFNTEMVPKVATSYYLYSKKDGNVSKKSSCQIGVSLRKFANEHRERPELLSILANVSMECAYLEIDGSEHIIPVDSDIKFVSNYEDFVESFKDDLENIKTSDKQITKKM